MKPELEKRCNEITKDLVNGLKIVKVVKKEVEQKETKKGYLILAVFILLVLTSSRLFANCGYLVKTKKGYRFNCGKVLVKFNHYKVLSVTQKLNQEQLELVSKDR